MAVGDSITEGVYTTHPPETAYPHLLELKLEETYHRNFISINAAVGGVYSDYFLIPPHTIADLIDTYQPDLVLLMIGTNDLGSTTAFWWTEANLRATITTALNKGVRFILASNPPPQSRFQAISISKDFRFCPHLPYPGLGLQYPTGQGVFHFS